MMTRTLSCLLILGILSVCIPQKAEAWGPLIRRGAQEVGRWLNSPSGQRKMRELVERPDTPEKVERAWDWIKDRASDIKEGIEDGINDLKNVNPFCVICSMTGVHMCSGSCSGSCSN